jgi:hypothetical protein
MEPISIIGAAVSVISAVDYAARAFEKTRKLGLTYNTTESRRDAHFWRPPAILRWVVPQLYARLEALHKDVLPGSDEILHEFRRSLNSDCSMVAVAVSDSSRSKTLASHFAPLLKACTEQSSRRLQ